MGILTYRLCCNQLGCLSCVTYNTYILKYIFPCTMLCILYALYVFYVLSILGWPLFSKVKNIDLYGLHIVPIDEKY